MIKKLYRNKLLILVLLLGLIIRILLNNVTYSKDAESFVIWSRYLQNHQLSQLYETLPSGYPPYPPTYYYVLKVLGAIGNAVNIWENIWLSKLLVKLPVFLSDITSAIIIFKLAKKWISKKHALVACAFYFLHPAIIYNTSVWGQIDSVISALCLLVIYLFIERRYIAAVFLYIFALTTKLQSFAILPLVAVLLYKSTSLINISKLFLPLLILVFILFYPIISQKGLTWTTKYFYNLPNQYPYTSIYSYNIWSSRGFIRSDKDKFLNLIEYRYAGLALFWVTALLIAYPLLLKNLKQSQAPFFAGLLLFFCFYFFSTRIHSRYIIYTLGFFAPFFPKYKLFGFFLSILVIANFILPQKTDIFGIVKLLNSQQFLMLFTLLGVVFLAVSSILYRRLLSES